MQIKRVLYDFFQFSINSLYFTCQNSQNFSIISTPLYDTQIDVYKLYYTVD